MLEIPSDKELLSLIDPVPPTETRHLSSVLPALTAAIGSPVTTRVHSNPQELARDLGMPKASSAIVVLIDGLGFWNLAERVGHTPYLRHLMQETAGPISTCYPSTTVAALGTFGTGTTPGLTGLLGYTQLNPENRSLAQMIQWVNAPDPLDLQREPTIFETLNARGIRATSVGLPNFKNSALTKAALRGSTYMSHMAPSMRVTKAAQSARKPGVTYLYIRDADKAGHNYSWGSQEWVVKLESVDAQLRQLRQETPKGTLIAITADHGMLNMAADEQIDIAQSPELMEGVAMLGGEPRAVMVYANAGVDPEDIATRWRTVLGTKARVVTRAEAIERNFYGPVEARIQPMLGDVLVSCAGTVTLVDSREQSEAARMMPGVHGSSTMLEQQIPLLLDVVD